MTNWQQSPAGLYVPPSAADGVYLPRKDGVRFADFVRLVDGTGTAVTIDPDTGEVSVDATGGTGVVEEVVAGTGISVDNTDPTHPIVSAAGGSAQVILLNPTTTPVTDAAALSPTTGALIFMKSGSPGDTTWDFRGLSALPTGWARRGIASETFDSAGMSASYAAGQSHYFTLGSSVTAGILETKMVSGPSTVMAGPQIFGSASIGATVSWFNSPSGALLEGLGSTHQYDSTFTNGGGTPAYPVWFRVRFGGASTVYGSYSTNGTSWSSEFSLASHSMVNINELALGNALGASSAVKWEYAKWSPNPVTGGLLGWWNGSTIVAF